MKILVINISNIGDIVSSLSIVNFLVQKYEKVDFYTLEAFAKLLEDEDGIYLKSFEEIEKIEYDMVFDLTSSKSSRKILKHINAKKVYGYHKSLLNKLLYWKIYTKTYPKNKFQNITKDFFPILDDFIDSYDNLELPKLSVINVQQEVDLVGIHLGARNPIRALPMPLVQDIIEYFGKKEYKIIIFGNDIESIDFLEAQYNFVTVFEGDLKELKYLMKRLRLFIGPDSGPIHIASALDVESIAIYGPNLYAISGPTNKNNRIKYVELDYSCRPCNQNKECKLNIQCLRNIDFQRDVKPLLLL